MKCPNCGKTKTVQCGNDRGSKYDLHLYIPNGTKRKMYAEQYACKDTVDYLKRSRPVIKGCGCEWEVNYKVTIEKKPITIIERGKEK